MWTKKPRVEASADAPPSALLKPEAAPVASDKPQPDANRPQARHRLAGSHEGMYVTEHHRRPRRRG